MSRRYSTAANLRIIHIAALSLARPWLLSSRSVNNDQQHASLERLVTESEGPLDCDWMSQHTILHLTISGNMHCIAKGFWTPNRHIHMRSLKVPCQIYSPFTVITTSTLLALDCGVWLWESAHPVTRALVGLKSLGCNRRSNLS